MSSGQSQSWIANTKGWHDGLHLAVVLLLLLGSADAAIGRLAGPAVERLGLLPQGAEMDYEALGSGVFLILALGLGWLAWVLLHRWLGQRQSFQVAKSAIMVPTGGTLYSLAGTVPIFVLAILAFLVELCRPGLLLHVPGVLFLVGAGVMLLVPAVCAGFWGGWRAGTRGAFWGGVAAALPLLAFLMGLPRGTSTVVLPWCVGFVLAGALAGLFGARRFQRGLAARQAEQAGGKPAA
jgi:hypothetical protein